MTAPTLAEMLDRLDMKQADLAREIEAKTGHKISKATLSNLVNGKSGERGMGPILVAYLMLKEECERQRNGDAGN